MNIKKAIPIIVLSAICITAALLLSFANGLTKEKIKENALKKEQASLIEVLPNSTVFEELDTSKYDLPKTLKSAYRESADLGYVLIMATSTEYSAEDMTVSVGIYPDGKVAGVSLTNYKESKDFGKITYPQKFIGTTADTYGSVDVTAGVTISSNAFKSLIGDAITAATEIEKNKATVNFHDTVSNVSFKNTSSLPRSDAELYLLINKLVDGRSFSQTEISEDAPDFLKRLYKVSKREYVAYIVVSGEYVPVATEGLVYIGESGKIKKLNLLSWVVGHGVGYGDFPEKFIGKDRKTVHGVELVSKATYTSGDFRSAVGDTFNYIPSPFPLWRIIGIISILVSVLSFIIFMIISKKRRTAG